MLSHGNLPYDKYLLHFSENVRQKWRKILQRIGIYSINRSLLGSQRGQRLCRDLVETRMERIRDPPRGRQCRRPTAFEQTLRAAHYHGRSDLS